MKNTIIVVIAAISFSHPCRLLVSAAEDIPCQVRPGDDGQGYICVCNSTYCDTIQRPSRLTKGQFHRYTTSSSSPGFTHTKGNFLRKSDNADDDAVFTVNSSVQFQEILGFGGSFTDAVGIVLNTLPAAAQDKLMESYFGPNGIEYSFGRVPIGASDFSLGAYTLDDVRDDVDLKYFNLTFGDNNYKVPLIQKALALTAPDRPFKVMACTWLAPSWMKDNDNNFSGYLKSKYLHAFAQYNIKFLEAYKDKGIDIWSLSGGNEVMLMLFFGFRPNSVNSTLMLAHYQRQWLKDHLTPMLRASSFSDVKVFTFEDQRPFAAYWMKRFAEDPEACDAFDGIGIHWYFDWISPVSVLDDIHNQFPDKLILYTETSVNVAFGPKAVDLGSWFRGEAYIYDIIENLKHWTNGYIDWNLCLTHDGGPYLALAVDVAVVVNATSGEFYKQPIFYAMGHFSKFIPPGAKRILLESNQNETSSGGQATAEDIRAFVNSMSLGSSMGDLNSIPLKLTINIPPLVTGIATANVDGSYTVIVVSTKNETQHVRIEDARVGTISTDVNPHSINSFIYRLD